MKATETKSTKTPKAIEKNYVIIDGRKVSRTWAAMLANKERGVIVDMKAVLK
jgi:hypothetical protein